MWSCSWCISGGQLMLPDMACCAVKLLPEFKNSLCLTQLAMLCSCFMKWGAARYGKVANSSCPCQRVAFSKVCTWLVQHHRA